MICICRAPMARIHLCRELQVYLCDACSTLAYENRFTSGVLWFRLVAPR